MKGVVFAQNLLHSRAHLKSSPNGSCMCTGQGIMTKNILYCSVQTSPYVLFNPQWVDCTAVEVSDMEVPPQCLNTLHL